MCFVFFNVCLSFFLSDSDMPDHDLEPPRFAQLALERVLQDWNALKSMIMFGSQENKDPWVEHWILANFIVQIQLSRHFCWHNMSYCFRLSASSRIAHLLPEEQMYLNQQSGTIRLDCFTHCLIVKCAPDITVSRRNCSCAFTSMNILLFCMFLFQLTLISL